VQNAFQYYPKAKWTGKNDLTPDRVYAATELMFWCGLRSSDATKFNSSEVVPNETGDGWCADYIQKKTKKRIGDPVPIPAHLKALLDDLTPLFISKDGKKYWFCTEN